MRFDGEKHTSPCHPTALDYTPSDQKADDDVERCFVCDIPFKAGDRVLDDVSGGTGHLACFGPEREGYVKDLDTGEPLGPDDPTPAGYVWEPLPDEVKAHG